MVTSFYAHICSNECSVVEEQVLKPCGPDRAGRSANNGMYGGVVAEPQYKAMANGVCEDGWEPIPASGPYGAPGAFEECAAAARALRILPVGPYELIFAQLSFLCLP
eukprot:COSAG02_NODE_43299_length_376_cov_0.682310_1_plen_106_part_01